MEHIKQAEQLLAKEGLKLGAVQNHFSLLRNDQQPIIDYCNSRGIRYYAYMVLEQGALAGRYDAQHHFPTFSMRNFAFPKSKFRKIEGLLSMMRDLAEKREWTLWVTNAYNKIAFEFSYDQNYEIRQTPEDSVKDEGFTYDQDDPYVQGLYEQPEIPYDENEEPQEVHYSLTRQTETVYHCLYCDETSTRKEGCLTPYIYNYLPLMWRVIKKLRI